MTSHVRNDLREITTESLSQGMSQANTIMENQNNQFQGFLKREKEQADKHYKEMKNLHSKEEQWHKKVSSKTFIVSLIQFASALAIIFSAYFLINTAKSSYNFMRAIQVQNGYVSALESKTAQLSAQIASETPVTVYGDDAEKLLTWVFYNNKTNKVSIVKNTSTWLAGYTSIDMKTMKKYITSNKLEDDYKAFLIKAGYLDKATGKTATKYANNSFENVFSFMLEYNLIGFVVGIIITVGALLFFKRIK